MKNLRLLSLFFFIGIALFAQKEGDDKFARTVEQSLEYFYKDYATKTNNYDSIINALNYEADQVPTFSDAVYCERLAEMNENTPFQLECNDVTLSVIKFFAAKRRGFARVVLGRSKLYFDMYEAKLAEHGLPIELKYLSVIESGLRPQVKSRAGALGLWQFMYGTGKMFGLKENSYVDERMDPALATDAACRYLKQLYGIYGDWNLALAAYNAGPGNVNKAIKRSGNKTTYWEVRPFLPKETQGYVPNFIAAAYLLTYHAEHNIIPAEAVVHYVELDTICLKSGVHMSTISKLVGWDENQIAELNPIFKKNYIPKANPNHCISGPLKKIGMLAGLEDSLYTLEEAIYNPTAQNTNLIVQEENVEEGNETNEAASNTQENEEASTAGTPLYHKVRSGETLGNIASRYGTTVSQLMRMNGLQSTNIYVGQRLKVNSTGGGTNTTETPPPTATKKYYTVRSGDTFGRIAQRHRLTITQLKKLNPGVNVDRISVGQRLRVK